MGNTEGTGATGETKGTEGKQKILEPTVYFVGLRDAITSWGRRIQNQIKEHPFECITLNRNRKFPDIKIKQMFVCIYMFDGFHPASRVDHVVGLILALRNMFKYVKQIGKLILLVPNLDQNHLDLFTIALPKAGIYNVRILDPIVEDDLSDHIDRSGHLIFKK